MEERIIAYKGFNRDLTCRGFQYEIGKEHHQEGEIEICKNGFHAHKNPLDVLYYYDDYPNDRYFMVEVWGNIVYSKEDTKLASSDIKIIKEIGFEELVMLGNDWLKKNCKRAINKLNKTWSSKPLKCNSDNNLIYCKTSDIRLSNKGNCSSIANIGSRNAIYNNSNQSMISNSGSYASIYSLGTLNYIINSDDYVQISNIGVGGKIICVGKYSSIINKSDSAKIYSDGDYAKINCIGFFCEINSNGKNANIVCSGGFNYVKAQKGSTITLTEWYRDTEVNEWLPKCTKTVVVDGKIIKENVAYTLKNGEFVEANKTVNNNKNT